MVCHRWTLALILIFVPLLVTVISAFRVSLPGRSHDVKSERRQKCEDCGVSDLNLDPVVHSFKKESAKRSLNDIKTVFSDKRHVFDEKFTKTVDKLDDFDDKVRNDDDDSESVKAASFEHLEKVETKSKLDTKPRTKKVSLILDFNDDDDDDDDSEVDDDDDYDLPKLSDHKKPVVVDSKKNTDEIKSTASVKPPPKPKDKKDETKENEEKDKTSGQKKQKLDIATVKTIIKESLKSKAEVEKPLKTTPKVEIDKKIGNEKDSKQSIKESDLPKIKVIIEPKDSSTKDPIVSEPKEKVVKSEGTEKQKEKPKQKSSDTKEPVRTSKEKVVEVDVPKIKNIPESKKSVETTPEEKSDSKRDTTKIESKDSRLQHISDALHRRNFLHSEFEDFYAFFPTFAPNFSRVHNPECRRHGQILLRQLRGTKLWALNMLDATAKIPSGLLQGNGIQLGDFDQCLGIRARVQLDTGSIVRIQGKYCLAMIDLKAEQPALEMPVHLAQARSLFKSRIDDPGHFVPRFSTLSWGVCVPSPCSPDDVEVILRDAVKHYQYKTGISIRVKADDHDCYTRKGADWWKEWLDLPTILTLSLYATVLILVLIATLQDFLSRSNSEEEPSDEGKSEGEEKEVKEKEKKTSDGFLSSFSLYNTLGKLVAPATGGEIACIHGVRAIATMALLLAHKFLPIGLTPYTNRLKISELVSSPLLSWCRAGWMFTDCFLLISGTLTSYRKSTSDTMAAKLLSRYFRLTPALLAVVLFYAYIWDNISTGPMWGTLVTRNAEVCQQGWWWNLLYVQNYFGFEEMCAPQTHHMAIDFQLTVLGGILVWAIQSDVPFSGTVMQLIHLLAAYSRYTTYRDHRLTAVAYQGVSVSQLYRTGRLSYTSILHRCSPYLIGLSLGLALRKTSGISKLLSFFGWFICSILLGLVLWAGADSGYFDYRYDVTFAAIYATLAPLATALGFAWIIYAVHKNSSGFLSLVLSSRPLLFISRISYALYLIQFIVYLTNTAIIRSPKEFSLATLIDLHEVFTILLSSILLTITLVIPLQSVPKISFITKTDTVQENEVEKEENEQNKIENDVKTGKEQIVREVPQRRSFMAHREVLEEIPEVDVEYEAQRDSNETLKEILEEENDLEEEMEDREDDDLEIIEEEQEEDEEVLEGAEYVSHSFTGDNEQDIDEWEWTADGNNRGSQQYRYSR